MPGDRFELLAAIRANPGDYVPRLALADWLDRQGGAEFAWPEQSQRLPWVKPPHRAVTLKALHRRRQRFLCNAFSVARKTGVRNPG